MAQASKLIGRTVAGRYTITGFIGEGGMARVYRGTRVDGGGDVAIKVMRGDLASDPVFLGRFKREALAAARLSHRNMARVIEHGVSQDLAFIVMDLLNGLDLYGVLSKEGRLQEARAAAIVYQVCAALDQAHKHGIVHRDLKPENVMLCSLDDVDRDPDARALDIAVAQTARGTVKVLDFGIAKLLDRPQGTPTSMESTGMTSLHTILTTVGALVGTPEYMSPEQCRGEPIDARSDLYACGMLLYQLVTARLPFEDRVPLKVITRQIDEVPKSPRRFVPTLHEGTERLILRALSKTREGRPQSAGEFMRELVDLLVELETQSTESQRTDTKPPPPQPKLPRLYTPTPSSAAKSARKLNEVVGQAFEGGSVPPPSDGVVASIRAARDSERTPGPGPTPAPVSPRDEGDETLIQEMQIFADGGEDEDHETRALLKKSASAFDSKLKPRAGAAGRALGRARSEDLPSVASVPAPSSATPDSSDDATRLVLTGTGATASPRASTLAPLPATASPASKLSVSRTAPSGLPTVDKTAQSPSLEAAKKEALAAIAERKLGDAPAPPAAGDAPLAPPKPKVRVSLPLAIAAGIVAAVLTFVVLAMLAGALRR